MNCCFFGGIGMYKELYSICGIISCNLNEENCYTPIMCCCSKDEQCYTPVFCCKNDNCISILGCRIKKNLLTPIFCGNKDYCCFLGIPIWNHIVH